jgi:hypothetical protein
LLRSGLGARGTLLRRTLHLPQLRAQPGHFSACLFGGRLRSGTSGAFGLQLVAHQGQFQPSTRRRRLGRLAPPLLATQLAGTVAGRLGCRCQRRDGLGLPPVGPPQPQQAHVVDQLVGGDQPEAPQELAVGLHRLAHLRQRRRRQLVKPQVRLQPGWRRQRWAQLRPRGSDADCELERRLQRTIGKTWCRRGVGGIVGRHSHQANHTDRNDGSNACS